MAGKKTPTHIAYGYWRESRTSGHWLEIGFATTREDGKSLHLNLNRLPTRGFNGHVLVLAKDTQPETLVNPSSMSDEDGF